uniref:Putative chemosensory protein n=1 Tax=Triatoma brasiliensis TaxID=65344 RepID=A0A162X323_TRIBS|nr:putative chemosensory protein [Triatoma brasiliensis]
MKKMKLLKLVALLILSASISTAEEPDNEFNRLFDPNVDVDAVLDNDRVLNAYLACFYDEGPCAERPKLVKSKIREVLETTCGKCNDQQRQRLKYILNKFIDKRPNDWQRILEIYDPDGAFRDNVEKLKQGLPAQ